MRFYISGKISGTTDYKERFAETEERIKTEMKAFSPEIVNPVKLCEEKGVKNWCDCMRVCIAALCSCDAVFLQKGFTESKGAMLEFNIATELDLLIFFEQQNYFV